MIFKINKCHFIKYITKYNNIYTKIKLKIKIIAYKNLQRNILYCNINYLNKYFYYLF